MSSTLDGLRALAGDALIAIGEIVRGESRDLELFPVPHRSDLPEEAQIPTREVAVALDGLPDSELLGIAAKVIEGWTPILLRTTRTSTNVDALVATLRDRAAQFEAAEYGVEPEPFLSRLGAHLTSLPRRGK